MGDKTKIAIMAFQTDNDMTPTGEVDEKLVQGAADAQQIKRCGCVVASGAVCQHILPG